MPLPPRLASPKKQVGWSRGTGGGGRGECPLEEISNGKYISFVCRKSVSGLCTHPSLSRTGGFLRGWDKGNFSRLTASFRYELVHFSCQLPSATGSGCSLMAARWQVFFPSWVPSGVTSSPSMTAGVPGHHILVYWYGRKYSISQDEWMSK